MIGRVVEIVQEGLQCHLYRGFLIVKRREEELGRVPLDDCESLILASSDVIITRQLLAELAQRHSTVVVCGSKYEPVGIYTPVVGNQRQAERQQAQVFASKPLQKQIWASLVKGKIKFQELLLRELRKEEEAEKLFYLGEHVQSGDKTNREAQAARLYWQALFGEHFRRDQEQEGANALLNYGYAILRSSVARALAGAGLLLGWGIGHSKKDNPFAFCDDVMEPFRPSVDRLVKELVLENMTQLTPEVKKKISKVLWMDLEIEKEAVPVMNAIQRLVYLILESFLTKKCQISFKDWSWLNKNTILTDTN